MLTPSPPLSLFTTVPTVVARNALPNAARIEGLVVYVPSTGIYYQLLPAPWDGTDSDWDVFSALHPYAQPIFTLFYLQGVGIYVVDGTVVSGAITFNWGTFHGANVATNSVSIVDVTASVVLASGLANDGTQTITLPSPVTLHTGDTHVWEVRAVDTKGVPLSRQFTVKGVTASDQTYYVRTDGSDSNNGLSNTSGGAWLTLQHAANTVAVGDHVNVEAGTYAGFGLGFAGERSGAQGHPIWFEGHGATINAKNSFTADAIDAEFCSYLKITGFVIDNDGTVTRAGIRISGFSFGTEVSDNEVKNSHLFGILTGFWQQCSVTDNLVHHIVSGSGSASGHGIYVANSGDTCLIARNTVHDCGGDGIHTNADISQGGTGIQTEFVIESNLLYSNHQTISGGAINCDGITNSTFENNLIYDEHAAGIALYRQDAATSSTGNVVVNNTISLASVADKSCIRCAAASVGNIVFNNVLWTAGSGAAMELDGDSLPFSDYNLLISRIKVDDAPLTLAQWVTFSGDDTHSAVMTSAASVWTSPGTGDFTLKPHGGGAAAGIDTYHGATAPDEFRDGTERPVDVAPDLGSEPVTDVLSIVSTVPADEAFGVAIDSTVSWTFDRDVVAGDTEFALTDHLGAPVDGDLSYDSGTFTQTFTPDADLTGAETFTATVSAAQGVDGVLLPAPVVWHFSTVGAEETGFGSTVPANLDSGDGSAITVGAYFTVSLAGAVTGIRFYKGTTNSGVHQGFLWSVDQDTGEFVALLASGTFIGETSDGWQLLTLGSPVSIDADTRYMVGCYMPNGHFSFDSFFFTSPYTNGASITYYADGADSITQARFFSGLGFPTDSFHSTNYWVDFAFVPGG